MTTASRLRQLSVGVACCMTAALLGTPAVAGEELLSPQAIAQELKSFRETGTVLYVAAHPDDENTQLITYFARGRGFRTAYLSVTRGDGGQNLLGGEFGEQLGVIRTQELLAARRLDGGKQFFTRAIDFGFSKDYADAIKVWGRKQVVADIVRVIRTFQPDIVINRFSTEPGGTHGHHTASGVLSLEAFKLAGDPKALPDLVGDVPPWQPKRILYNGGGGRGGAPTGGGGGLRLDVGGNDPVLGESFGDIAGRSRAMHKSQGFGNFGGGGGRGGGGARSESFTVLDGAPATSDIFEGIDTTWNRVKGGAEIAQLADETSSKFNPQDLAASVPNLLKLHHLLAALPDSALVIDKRAQLNRIIQSCLGLTWETTVEHAEVVPGEEMKLHSSATASGKVSVRWVATRYPQTKSDSKAGIVLVANLQAVRDATMSLPADAPLSQPYWLRSKGAPGLFAVDNPKLIGQPENPPAYAMEQVFEVNGESLVFPDEPAQVVREAGKPEQRRKLQVIPPVTLDFTDHLALLAPGASHSVEVEIVAARPAANGTLKLDAPEGWKVSPASQSFKLAKAAEKTRLKFTLTAPAKAASATVVAVADIGGKQYRNSRIDIRYDHIPPQLLQPVASVKAVSLNLATRGKNVGYLAGAGDSVEESLRQMGYNVTELALEDVVPDKLGKFDAIVTGVRFFDTHRNATAAMTALFSFVEAGGNVVMQYNRVDGLQSTPLKLRVSQSRVTDENATMTFLAPDHPALNTPNKITAADFEGWVQERGIYFPSQWDDSFTPILACNDAGEAPLNSSLLVAKFGKGYFVYTGLAFFRQLPEGVPGAERLFANLVSLGK